MLKFFSHIALLLGILSACITAHSQILYKGHISDVASFEPLSGVEVNLKEADMSTLSNSEGNFVFLHPDISFDSTATLSGNFATQGNILVWNFNARFNLQIFGSSGILFYSGQDMPPSGYMSLNAFRNGLFFIRLHSTKGNAVFKLVSVNNNFLVSQEESNQEVQSAGKLLSDTILFNKEGYFPVKKGVNYETLTVNVKLLKRSYDQLDYFHELIAPEAFDMVSSNPSKTHMGEVSSVKIIYDASEDLMYYMNSKVFSSHYYFALTVMDYLGSQWTFNHTQYIAGPARYLYPVTLNYYKGLDIYTLEFFSGDEATCEEVNRVFDKIQSTSFIGDKLYFYSTNDFWSICNDMPVITANELFEGQNYQALNLAEGYGYLRKVGMEDLDDTYLNRHDIVVLNGIPIDISVVAGIITTEFQTPLSHINVLSHNRGTPNMALRDAWTNPKLDSLFGRLVCLRVESDSFTIRSASYEEAQSFWQEHEPQDTIFLDRDEQTQGLVDLDHADLDDVSLIGGKAANFAELLNAFEEISADAPVPEEYFAIPFYYYVNHITEHGLDVFISGMLDDPDFYTDSEFRQEKLSILRDSIISSPLEEELLTLVLDKLNTSEHFASFRFRSSTNAEDLEGFNGAGLYASYTGRPEDEERPVDEAIKKVWASLWNFRAFEERDYFRIAHESCAMGILVHRSFPDEDANGVAITKNLYNANHGFIINVQFGEHSIIDPEPGVLHDQIILYTTSISGEDPFTCEYICHSNIPGYEQQTVMTEEELFTLGDFLETIKHFFFEDVYTCGCNYLDFGLDVEFKVDSELSPRRIYIKQVRPY